MSTTSPARLYAMVVGVVLVAAGVIGFFYESSFTTDASVRGSVFGLLDVNGWHNVVHIATGLLGILAARTLASARTYCLVFALVYLVFLCVPSRVCGVWCWGSRAADTAGWARGFARVNPADNVLHLLLAAGG